MNIRETLLAIEERSGSIGAPDQEIGTKEQIKFMTVGTGIDALEFEAYVTATFPMFMENLIETKGQLEPVINAIAIYAFLAGHLYATSNAQ